MLKIEKEVKLTETKFHEAQIYPLKNKQIYVSLQTNLSSNIEESDSISRKYSYDTYAFRSINQSYRMLRDLKIMDLKSEIIGQSQDQSKLGLFISNSSKELHQQTGNTINFRKIKESTKKARILNDQKYVSFDYHRTNLLVDKINDLQVPQNENKIRKRLSNNIIYSAPTTQHQNRILSLQKLDQSKIIFHIGHCCQDEQIHKQLKYYDLIHQSVAWKFNMPRYYSMTSKIIKASENTFMNGVADFNTSIVLKLFDLRVSGAVSNLLFYQGDVIEVLQGQWNGRGFLGFNFDFMLKTNTQFQFLGIIGISLGAFNFPYYFDLRRPEQIQTLGFPNGTYFKHLKSLQICDQDLLAIERQYHNFSFKQSKLSLSHITYD